MRRRYRAVLAGGVAAVVAGALVVTSRGPGGSAADADDGAPMRETAPVATRDLVEREELDGTLGYGEARDVALSGQGTITGLAAEGSVVDRGGVLAEVDGRPVRLLFGDRPLWRTLDAAVSDGPDVRQLEENLVKLGLASTASLTVDDDWTDATTAAVKRWQKKNGVAESGVVAPGDAVVLPGPVRIAERKVALGASAAPAAVLSVTGTEKVVTVDLDASRRDLLPVDAAVDVELPDGRTVGGTVRSVSSVVTPPADEAKGGRPTIAVVISLAPGEADGAFDAAPVDVLVTANRAEGVLTVPVDALLALAEGGYAVERVRDGVATLVTVEPGAFADGHVQISGDVAVGDEVVVPR